MNCSGPAVSAPLILLSFSFAFSFPSDCSASLVGAGDIAFLRFNADGTDDFAIVLLADADMGQQVHFNNRQYSSTFGIFGGAGDAFTWNITEDLTAGTVVSFSNLSNALSPGVVSEGTLTGDATNTMQLGASGDTVYAFLGPSNSSPTTFLAAVSTENSSVLNGTDLTAGDTAIILPAGIDEAHYIGDRDTEMAFPDYRPLIGNVSGNWAVRTTDTGSLGAFDTTNFSLAGAAIPESPRIVQMCLWGLLFGLAVVRSRRPRQAVI